MARSVTRILSIADRTHVRRVRACDICDQDFVDVRISTATEVIEIDDALGVLLADHRGRPLIASVRPVVGFLSPQAARANCG